MKTNISGKNNSKNYLALYETMPENGTSALKPLPAIASPHLHLVSKPAEKAAEEEKGGNALSRVGKYVLGFVALFGLFALLNGGAALMGDLAGAGAVAYFSVRALG